MKAWIHKLMDGLEFDWKDNKTNADAEVTEINEELASLLYVIDHYNKFLFEIADHPLRKTRQEFDEYARLLVKSNAQERERSLFNFRKFFSSYRIDEVSYIQQSFDDFKSIIWDFVDQLAEDFRYNQGADNDLKASFEQLKDAVEADRIDDLRNHSRQFIDCFIEHQTRKEKTQHRRIHQMKKNLDLVREKLVEANDSMQRDYLTGAFNRASFDKKLQEHWRLQQMQQQDICLAILDIDYFKKINDNYGHPMGDFILKECVKILQQHFSSDHDFVARIGGEEFAIILPGRDTRPAERQIQQLQDSIRKEIFIEGEHRIQFTISVGLAQLQANESTEAWIKRADDALYDAKNSGRDRCSIAPRSMVRSA